MEEVKSVGEIGSFRTGWSYWRTHGHRFNHNLMILLLKVDKIYKSKLYVTELLTGEGIKFGPNSGFAQELQPFHEFDKQDFIKDMFKNADDRFRRVSFWDQEMDTGWHT